MTTLDKERSHLHFSCTPQATPCYSVCVCVSDVGVLCEGCTLHTFHCTILHNIKGSQLIPAWFRDVLLRFGFPPQSIVVVSTDAKHIPVYTLGLGNISKLYLYCDDTR